MSAILDRDLVRDLGAESASLDALVAPLPPEKWATPTPAEGWTIAHQIAHLAWTDRLVLVSAIHDDGLGAAAAAAAHYLTGVSPAGAPGVAAAQPHKLLIE